MAEYIVSPTGRDDAPGTVENPMSKAKAEGALAWKPQPRDKLILRGGVWAGLLQPRVSGQEGAPIEYTVYPGEVVHFDGSPGARNRIVARPDAWNDVPRETGWNSVPHSYQPRNKGGGAVGSPRSEPNVYRKAGGGIRGVFVDAYQEGMGAPVAGRFAALWDMGAVNLYQSNPGLDIHSYDANHDQFENRTAPQARQHGAESQWKAVGSDILLRVYGPDWNANNHAIYFARFAHGLLMDHINHVTVNGDGRWRIWRSGYNVKLQNCRGIKLLGLDVAFSGQSAFHADQCDDLWIEGGRYFGGGSTGHQGETFWPAVSRNVVMVGVEVAWGGHSGVWYHKIVGGRIENCHIHDTGGHGVGLIKNVENVTVRKNRLVRTGRHEDADAHKVDHIGVNAPAVAGCIIEENTFEQGGSGVAFSQAGSFVTQGNRVHGNVFRDMNNAALLLTTFSGAPLNSCRDNTFEDNVIDNCARDKAYSRPDGSIVYVELLQAGADMDNNRIRGLTVRQPGVAAGSDPKVYWVWSHPNDKGWMPGTRAQVETTYPGFLTNVKVEEYQPGPDPEPPDPPEPPDEVTAITAVTPSPIVPGQSATIKGRNLRAVARVLWSTSGETKAVNPTGASATEVTCVTRADTITGECYLRFTDGTASNKLEYRVGGGPEPPPEPVRIPLTSDQFAATGGAVGAPGAALLPLVDAYSGWIARLKAADGSSVVQTLSVRFEAPTQCGRLVFQVGRGTEGRIIEYEVFSANESLGKGTSAGGEITVKWTPRSATLLRLAVKGESDVARIGKLEAWSA